jgi:hypothetical protein
LFYGLFLRGVLEKVEDRGGVFVVNVVKKSRLRGA